MDIHKNGRWASLFNPSLLTVHVHPCSLIRLYTVDLPTSNSNLDILKLKMDSSKNGSWTSSFKKFSTDRHTVYLTQGDSNDYGTFQYVFVVDCLTFIVLTLRSAFL